MVARDRPHQLRLSHFLGSLHKRNRAARRVVNHAAWSGGPERSHSERLRTTSVLALDLPALAVVYFSEQPGVLPGILRVELVPQFTRCDLIVIDCGTIIVVCGFRAGDAEVAISVVQVCIILRSRPRLLYHHLPLYFFVVCTLTQ